MFSIFGSPNEIGRYFQNLIIFNNLENTYQKVNKEGTNRLLKQLRKSIITCVWMIPTCVFVGAFITYQASKEVNLSFFLQTCIPTVPIVGILIYKMFIQLPKLISHVIINVKITDEALKIYTAGHRFLWVKIRSQEILIPMNQYKTASKVFPINIEKLSFEIDTIKFNQEEFYLVYDNH